MEARSKLPCRAPFWLRVQSLTKPGITYAVRYSNRRWTCSCPSARHGRGACKHVAMLRVLGLRRVRHFAESAVTR